MLDAALCAQQRGALPSTITLRALLFSKATVMLCALSPMCHQTRLCKGGLGGPTDLRRSSLSGGWWDLGEQN